MHFVNKIITDNSEETRKAPLLRFTEEKEDTEFTTPFIMKSHIKLQIMHYFEGDGYTNL